MKEEQEEMNRNNKEELSVEDRKKKLKELEQEIKKGYVKTEDKDIEEKNILASIRIFQEKYPMSNKI